MKDIILNHWIAHVAHVKVAAVANVAAAEALVVKAVVVVVEIAVLVKTDQIADQDKTVVSVQRAVNNVLKRPEPQPASQGNVLHTAVVLVKSLKAAKSKVVMDNVVMTTNVRTIATAINNTLKVFRVLTENRRHKWQHLKESDKRFLDSSKDCFLSFYC
jgi:hypothetical protein